MPRLDWPVSFVGFSYFIALLAAWVADMRRRAARPLVDSPLAWVARAGAAASLAFIGVMISLGRLCPYCLGVHAGNLGFIINMEVSRRMPRLENQPRGERRRPRRAAGERGRTRQPDTGRRTLGLFAAVFVLSTLLLGAADARHRAGNAARAESERRASTSKIVGGSVTPPPIATPPADPWGPQGFTGRYRRGPESAVIRIVALTDYQCPDCRRVEEEIESILASHPDVSFSVKHFPMCRDAARGVVCNRAAPSNLHPNACWAARAAETAGILKGDTGFWAMHRWLFAHGGSFTDRQLAAGLTSLGFEPAPFTAVMSGEETLRRVRADIEEGLALGLHYTPMIFVNGIEFRGWQTPGALARSVEEVAATHPPVKTAAADRPSLAAEKYLEDWHEQPARVIPAARAPHAMGKGGRAEVVLFGDYLEAHTAAMDRAIRAEAARNPGLRYVFRHYPIDPDCNPALPAGVRPEAVHRGACRAARAAEAAGVVGGDAAFWAVHAWLMDHAGTAGVGDPAISDAARAAGLDPRTVLAHLDDPAVTAAIAADARAATNLGLTALPMVLVNGRWVPRTMRDDENVVLRIVQTLSR